MKSLRHTAVRKGDRHGQGRKRRHLVLKRVDNLGLERSDGGILGLLQLLNLGRQELVEITVVGGLVVDVDVIQRLQLAALLAKGVGKLGFEGGNGGVLGILQLLNLGRQELVEVTVVGGLVVDVDLVERLQLAACT